MNSFPCINQYGQNIVTFKANIYIFREFGRHSNFDHASRVYEGCNVMCIPKAFNSKSEMNKVILCGFPLGLDLEGMVAPARQ